MRGRVTIMAGLTTLLVALTLWVGVPTTAAIAGSIVMTVNCTGNPEATVITNNTDETLDLSRFTLTSLFQPRENEPFQLSGTLAPGAPRILRSGEMAPAADRLTGQFIYENDAAGEGALLSTPFGTLQVLCGVRTGSLQVSAPAQPTATTAATTVATSTIPPRTPATMPATVTLAPTRTIPPGTAVTTVPLAPATAIATATAAPTATVVMPRGLPNTGAGGGGLNATGPLAAIMAAIVLFGALVSRERRRR